MYITQRMILHPTFDKTIPGTSLTGRSALGPGSTAKARPAGAQPPFSYLIAKGILDLLNGTMSDVKLIGYTSEQSPDGILVTVRDKDCAVYREVQREASEAQLSIKCAHFIGKNWVPIEAGAPIVAYMLANHGAFADLPDAVRNLLKAKASGNAADFEKALAVASDTVMMHLDDMLSRVGKDNITSIELVNKDPETPPYGFTGGDLLAQAFVGEAGLDAFLGAEKKHLTVSETLYGEAFECSFVGELPLKLKDAVARGMHCLLTGPTETGKTLCVEEVAMTLGAPVVLVKGFDGLDDRDIIGSSLVLKDPQDPNVVTTQFAPGPLVEALQLGQKQQEKQLQENAAAEAEGRDPERIPPAVLFVDEFNRIQTRYQNLFLAALNVMKSSLSYCLRIPDTQEIVTCPKGFFVIVAARNFGSAYVGTNDVDIATLRRFDRKFDVTYLEPEEEIKLIVRDTGADEQLARVLVRCANDVRSQMAELQSPLGHKTNLLWAEELMNMKKKGVALTQELLLNAARDIWFDVVVGRDENGRYNEVGEQVITENLEEGWKEVYG